MRRLLLIAAVLRVCWGPDPRMCGEFLGRREFKAGGAWVNYYVVRLADGSVSLIEPDLIEKVLNK